MPGVPPSAARVNMALGNWAAARQEDQEVGRRQAASDGGMSMRTDELEEAEELRNTIRKKRDDAK